MIVKIELSTGKEIKLTKQEFDELCDSFRGIIYQIDSATPTYLRPDRINPVIAYAAP